MQSAEQALPPRATVKEPWPNAMSAGSPGSQGSKTFDSKGWLADTTGEMRDGFARNRRVISFAEYLTLFGADRSRQLRSAGAIRPRRVRSLRHRDRCDPARGDDALAAVRLPVGRRQGRADRPGGGAGRGLPAGLELRARGAREQAHPAARSERLREVDVRRLPAAGDRALLDARRGRALPVQLDLPVAEADQGRHRLRRRRSSTAAARRRPSRTWTTSSSTRRSPTSCATTRCCSCRAASAASWSSSG